MDRFTGFDGVDTEHHERYGERMNTYLTTAQHHIDAGDDLKAIKTLNETVDFLMGEVLLCTREISAALAYITELQEALLAYMNDDDWCEYEADGEPERHDLSAMPDMLTDGYYVTWCKN